MGKSTISTGPCSIAIYVCLAEGKPLDLFGLHFQRQMSFRVESLAHVSGEDTVGKLNS